jgi:hypothetical protein
MTQTNLKLLVEIAQLRVRRARNHLDRQREDVAGLERAGQDTTTSKRLLKISEQALATLADDRDRLTKGSDGQPRGAARSHSASSGLGAARVEI